MKTPIGILAAVLILLSFSSCQTAYNSARYEPTMTPEEMAASERSIERVEDKARQHRHEERMSRAQAEELATRNRRPVYYPW